MQGQTPDLDTHSGRDSGDKRAVIARCKIQPDVIGVGPGELLGLHEVSALRRTSDQCSFLDAIIASWLKPAGRHGMLPVQAIVQVGLQGLATLA